MAEQDRFHQIVGDGAAIDGHERLRFAFAAAVDGAGEQFLADAGFAFDQHRDGGGGRLLRGAHDVRHGLAAGDDIGKGQAAFAAVSDALQFAFQRAGVQRIAKRHLQPFHADRLDDEIMGPGTHRRHHIVDAAMGGLHDDGDGEAGLADLGQHAHAVEAGHHEIEHHGVDGGRVRCGEQGDRRVSGVHDDGLIAAFLHHVFNQAALYRVIVGDQNAGSHGFPRTLQLSVSNRGTLADAD
ncbi:MAG: hypothetical protein NVS2B1_02650 [Bradyrhizobium sp.]